MKKEELIKRLYTHKIIGDKDLMQILEEAGFKDYAISSIINKIADIINAPLHPADGAVPDNAAEQNKRMREWFKERTGLDDTLLSIHMKQIDVMLKGVQPQPTAEGAEEIDDETIAWAAEHQCGTPFSERWIGFVKGAKWHRSLHAQRIAEKMVEEKLREGLIAYGKVIRSWGIAIPSDILECSIDEYLKTRDSHE
jgi:hypothetical protein